MTDDPERTIESYARLGLEVRRIRELGNGKSQTFFRAGEVVIEVVGPVRGGDGDGGGVEGRVHAAEQCERRAGRASEGMVPAGYQNETPISAPAPKTGPREKNNFFSPRPGSGRARGASQ